MIGSSWRTDFAVDGKTSPSQHLFLSASLHVRDFPSLKPFKVMMNIANSRIRRAQSLQYRYLSAGSFHLKFIKWMMLTFFRSFATCLPEEVGWELLISTRVEINHARLRSATVPVQRLSAKDILFSRGAAKAWRSLLWHLSRKCAVMLMPTRWAIEKRWLYKYLFTRHA